MEESDISHLLDKLLSKWYYFVGFFLFTCLMAVLYLKTTEEKYLVAGTIQLKDKGRGDKALSQEEFLSGVEFLGAMSELEDEVGILTSYSLIRQTLRTVQPEVQYFEYPELLGMTIGSFAKEIYPAPFTIVPDSSGWQVINARIDITFIGEDEYRIELKNSGSVVALYNTRSNATLKRTIDADLDTILSVNSTLKTPFLHFSMKNIDPEVFVNNKKYAISFRTLDQAAQYYESQLTTNPISANANIIRLSLNSIVPARDIIFLQYLCDEYVANDLRKKNQLGERTMEFIDYQLQTVTDSLRNAESSLENFRSGSNIMDVSVTSQNLSGKLAALEEQHALLSVQKKYYRYIATYLTKSNDVADIASPSSVGIQDQMLSSLILQLSTLNQEKVGRSYSSTESNPALQVLEQKISMAKKALAESINNLIGSNEIAMTEVTQRIAIIRSSIGRLPGSERSLTDIRRKFEFNDNIYNYLIQKRAEAGIAIAANVPDKNVVDYPRQIRKLGPNPFFVFMLAILAGVFVPAGFVFAIDYFDAKIESINQLASITSLPIIERVALANSHQKKFASANHAYLAHSFRYVRQQIVALKRSKNIKTIGITSAMSGEGKTFCSYNLALSLTSAGYKTILIDLDLQQPKLAKHFRVNSQPGITDFLLNGKSQVIQATRIQKLDIVAAGTPVENPSDLLSHEGVERLVDSLKEKYDFLIFDTPPLGIVPDYLSLSKIVDYTIVVVRNNYSKKESIKRVSKLITDYNLPTGILYNGTRPGPAYGNYYK